MLAAPPLSLSLPFPSLSLFFLPACISWFLPVFSNYLSYSLSLSLSLSDKHATQQPLQLQTTRGGCHVTRLCSRFGGGLPAIRPVSQRSVQLLTGLMGLTDTCVRRCLFGLRMSSDVSAFARYLSFSSLIIIVMTTTTMVEFRAGLIGCAPLLVSPIAGGSACQTSVT